MLYVFNKEQKYIIKDLNKNFFILSLVQAFTKNLNNRFMEYFQGLQKRYLIIRIVGSFENHNATIRVH